MSAVMLPTGNSEWVTKIRAKLSATSIKPAPKSMENANKCRVLLPQISLVRCGMINPINPITPQIETVAAISIEEMSNIV